MGKNEPRKNSAFVWIAASALIVFFVVSATIFPSIVSKIKSANLINPTNFDDANFEFFEKLSNQEITIVSPTTKILDKDMQRQIEISVVPLQKDLTHNADQENWVAHANGTVLVFACYELLHGDKDMGKKLLKMLKQHDNDINYNYPTNNSGLLPDYGANISIDDFVSAADKYLVGDSSVKIVLEKPASQYEWRLEKYGSTSTVR